MTDPRPDELLRECGRISHRLGLSLAWTDGLEGGAAKACSRGGSAAWKRAKPLPGNEDAAAAHFATRARKKNPVVVLGASGLVGIEADGELDELRATLGIPALPATVTVRSRRGLHHYYRPPAGRATRKIQLDPDGVVVSEDGYLVGAGALHPSGAIYRYESNGAIAELPVELYDLLVEELGGATRTEMRTRFESGEPIPEGHRDVALFWVAVDQLRDGARPADVLERLLELGRTGCVPPLDEKAVRKQFKGATRWVAEHPTESERARAEARRILDERRAGVQTGERPGSSSGRKRKRALLRRPLSEVKASKTEWLIPRLVPVGALTLVAGVGGLGKSALVLAWAARLTRDGASALMVSYEDEASRVLRPRFEAAGGNLELLHELYVDPVDGLIVLPTDLDELARHVHETTARLLVVDPISASLDLKLDAHRDQDVRVVLGQMTKLAEQSRLASIQVAHLNKAPASDPYLRVNGSTGFYNASRSVITVTRDPADPDWSRLVTQHKSNYGPLGDVERWRVTPTTVICDGLPVETMVLEFVEIADDVNRDDVLATRAAGADRLDDAIAYLTGALADGEWHDSAGLKILAGGIPERTLQRAAQELELEHERRGYPSSTWWRLPQSRHALSPTFGATGETA